MQYPKVNSNNDVDLTALWGDMIIDQLESVEIYGMIGTKPQLQFIKLLLASTPSLRLLKLNMNRRNSLEEELRISLELLLFPRASSSAQIIWAEIKSDTWD